MSSTGQDILGIIAAFSGDKQHDQDLAFRREELDTRMKEVQSQDEQTNFWKQQQLANYLQSHRETLSHDYDAATSNYLTAFDRWNTANNAVQAAKLNKMPADNLMSGLAIAQQGLQFAQERVQKASGSLDSIDAALPQIIANFSPPRQVGQSGGQPSMPSTPPPMGRDPYAQPSMALPSTPPPQAGAPQAGSSEPPAEIRRPKLGGPGIGDYPSQGQDAEPQAQEDAGSAQGAPATSAAHDPVQYWGEMLKGYGFPKPEGGGDGTSLNYVVDREEQAQLLRDRLKTISKAQFDIPVPATVVSREALAKDGIAKHTILAGQSRSLGNRIAFYKSLTKSSDMVAMIRAIANDPNSEMGKEEGGNFATVLDANEKDRINIVNGIVRDLEDQQRPIDERLKKLSSVWDVYMKTTLAPILEPTASSNVGTSAPTLSQGDFFKKYAADHGITPPISDSQHKELMDAWNAYNTH